MQENLLLIFLFIILFFLLIINLACAHYNRSLYEKVKLGSIIKLPKMRSFRFAVVCYAILITFLNLNSVTGNFALHFILSIPILFSMEQIYQDWPLIKTMLSKKNRKKRPQKLKGVNSQEVRNFETANKKFSVCRARVYYFFTNAA